VESFEFERYIIDREHDVSRWCFAFCLRLHRTKKVIVGENRFIFQPVRRLESIHEKQQARRRRGTSYLEETKKGGKADRRELALFRTSSHMLHGEKKVSNEAKSSRVCLVELLSQ
jgi:hypothetical protein